MQTLDDMLIETARYCDVEISKSNGAYAGDSLVIANSLTSALNYAYRKIVLEKIPLDFKELVTDTSYLTKTFYKAISLTNLDGEDIDYTIETNQVKYNYDDEVYLLYYYMPNELVNLTDITELPPNVDLRIMCYYAAYFYLSNDSDERSNIYLDLWQDGFSNLHPNKKIQFHILDEGDWC